MDKRSGRGHRPPVSGARRALRREADMPRRKELVRGAPLLPKIKQVLATYVPRKVATADWKRVRPTVHDWFLLASPTDDATATRLLLTLARVVLWAEERHLPLDAEVLFTPEMVDRFADHVGTTNPNLAKTMGPLLRRYGPVMGDPLNWAKPAQQHARGNVKPPVTLAEEELAMKIAASWSVHHEAMVALGFGFGLDGRWLPHVYGSDLVLVDDWPHLNVPDPDARQVPVLAKYKDVILDIVDRVPTGPFIGGADNIQNRCWALARRIVLSDEHRLHIGQMRSTWFAAHLRNNTDLVYLSRISGRKSFQRLLELLEHVEPADPTEAARHARLA